MPFFKDEPQVFFERTRTIIKSNMMEAHFHPKHELYYLKSGQTTYVVENEIFLLNAGDFIFIPQGAFHKTSSDKDSLVERILFIFDNDFAGDAYVPYIEELAQNRHVRLPQEALYRFQEIFTNILSEQKQQKKDYLEMQKLYLRQLLVLISRYRKKTPAKAPNETYQLIQSAAKYIRENCSSDLSLSSLAARFAVSPGYFSKLFKKETGIALCEYIAISRITEAQSLLRTQKMPMTRVAELCGFNDSNYFTQVFKRYTGITPKKYALESALDAALGQTV